MNTETVRIFTTKKVCFIFSRYMTVAGIDTRKTKNNMWYSSNLHHHSSRLMVAGFQTTK